MTPKPKAKKPQHTKGGNCWDPSVIYDCTECGGEFCDVCHKHDRPRGQCETCPVCKPCWSEAKGNNRG